MTDDAAQLDLSRYEGHTPEPWDIGPVRDGHLRIYHEICAYVRAPTRWPLRLASTHNFSDGISEEEADANARLMGDAPALLAEVKRLREQVARLSTGEALAIAQAEVARLREARNELASRLEDALPWIGPEELYEQCRAALASAGKEGDHGA